MKKLLILSFILLISITECNTGSNRTTKETTDSQAIKILAIGDSNGAIEGGWVDQLRAIRIEDSIYSTCISGNTIGFDNLGRQKLNTLRNLDKYMNDADSTLGGIDRIIIILGTNDCKAVFADSAAMVPVNFSKMLDEIRSHPVFLKYKPGILVLSPPPMDIDENMIPKYHGGRERVLVLNSLFREICGKKDILYLDIQNKLLPGFDSMTTDGVHFNETGQKMIAREIDMAL